MVQYSKTPIINPSMESSKIKRITVCTKKWWEIVGTVRERVKNNWGREDYDFNYLLGFNQK